jgi:hypothetical protein
MYTPGLLLIGVLVLVALGQREHLTISAPMVDIRATQNAAETDRIYGLAPESLKSLATNSNAPNPNPAGGDKAKNLIVAIIQDFQGSVYVPATAPITEAVVDSYVARILQVFNTRPDTPTNSFYKTAFSNGDAKRLVMAYMGLTADASLPPVNPLPTSSTTAISIPSLLASMRDNLLEYKMTGNPRYKSAYDGTKTWMDRYIASLNTKLARESDAITEEVTRYRTANADMTKTQSDFQRVKTEGPKAENTYLTIKQQMDQIPVFDGSTNAYIKVGIAGGLAIVAGVLSFV